MRDERFLFIYLKDGVYTVIGLGKDSELHDKLIDAGHKHIATISGETWLEMFLNENGRQRAKMIENLHI